MPPRIESVTHNGTGTAGEPVTVTVLAQDVVADPLTYQFDFDGNGVFEVTNSSGNCHSRVRGRRRLPGERAGQRRRRWAKPPATSRSR